MPQACQVDGYPCHDSSFGFGNLLDIPGMVEDAVTRFLGTLVEQVMKPVREMLADTLLATPDVTTNGDVKRLWTAMLGITAGIYGLFVTAGGITVMGYETVQTRYALKEIAPRLLFGVVGAATSLTVMGKAIGLSNAVAHAVMATDMSDAAQGAIKRALPLPITPSSDLFFVMLGLVAGALVLATLIGFVIRVTLMALLAVCAPLALACHAHPLTDPIARLWWRGLTGCLAIQIAQSMTFVLSLKLFFAPGATALGLPAPGGLGTTLAGLSLFWVLFKIPGWALQVVLRGSPVQSPRASAPLRMLKHLAMYQLMGRPYVHGPRRPGGQAGGFGWGGGGPRGPGGRSPSGAGGFGGPPATGRPGRTGGSVPRMRTSSNPRRGGSADPSSQTAPGPRTGTTARARMAVSSRPAPAGGSTPRSRPGTSGPVQPTRGPRTPQRARTQRSPGTARGPAPARRGGPAPTQASSGPPRSPQPASAPAQTRAAAAQGAPTRASAVQPATSPRGRQMALPIPAERVRKRPPRPMQLRLPLEPPRSNSR